MVRFGPCGCSDSHSALLCMFTSSNGPILSKPTDACALLEHMLYCEGAQQTPRMCTNSLQKPNVSVLSGKILSQRAKLNIQICDLSNLWL